MWVFTETGFVSAVRKVDSPSKITVRSRDKQSLEVLAELALILLAVVILPIRLLLMVMVPAVFVLFIPYKLLALVASLFAVIDPIVLF